MRSSLAETTGNSARAAIRTESVRRTWIPRSREPSRRPSLHTCALNAPMQSSIHARFKMNSVSLTMLIQTYHGLGEFPRPPVRINQFGDPIVRLPDAIHSFVKWFFLQCKIG